MAHGRPTLLLVAGDGLVRDQLRALLDRAAYTLEVASDGAAGLARAESGGIDLVLADLSLPDLGGLEFCRRLRAQVGELHLPVILFGASAPGEADAALAAGADDYLAEPLDQVALLDRVRVWAQAGQHLRVAHQRLLAARAGEQQWHTESEARAQAEALAELARQGAADPDADRVVGLITEHAARLLGADYAGG